MPPLPSASRGSTYKTYAHLTVLSDEISPDELEARIGLRPDVAWAKGEPARGGKRQQQSNAIEYLSTVDRQSADPSEHVEELVERLRPRANELRKLASDERIESVRFWIYWSTSGENPGFELSRAAVEGLGLLGVTLAVDIYFFADEDD